MEVILKKFDCLVFAGALMLAFMTPFVSLLAQEAPSTLPAPHGWSAFQDPSYGATIYYPSNWFAPPVKKADGYEFASLNKDGAVLFLKTEFDELRTGAKATVDKLKSGTGAHRITDVQLGEMWYEMMLTPSPIMKQVTRVLYSCKERVVNAVTLIYPASRAKAYEAMLVKMKRRFSSGIGVKTPVRECA